ncbi:ARM repeat-containing protein [Aaosphaeria arxii CBS 175.79]|uniref:ARM repeat-containing protein n=1 Tax=Aaosphaeria arxii CBS 175.79 TaxID=1450172 RepID=A0A6A5X7B6_9PLEO|nr:ARM repeat-containing protein [Aaosphaeria arxii CBS 175.79]KAF2008848.1 ARM repeat-containing protein [Aaosphaeria arxii CBS 175.79]
MADAPPPSQSLPLGLEEIERLVKSLYEPGNAKKISETEATLRVLQHSPQGWEIADALLNNSDENVRFFGALTFTIKLNNDSASLSEEHSQQLLSKLIYHLVSRDGTSVSTRKLCSTLAQYFSKPVSTWENCIRSLVLSFAQKQPVLDDDLDSQPSTWDVLPQLSDNQVLILLDFAMNLSEEVKKLSNAPDRTPHKRMIANAESIEALLQVSFGRGIKYFSTPEKEESMFHGEKLCVASLKCFSGWVGYAQSEFKEVPEKMQYLRSVSELALSCLEYHVDDAMETVAEILENYPKFFETKHLNLLWSAIMSPWGIEILKNLDAETVSLARIIVAYGQILLESKKLFQEHENEHHQQVMSVLHELLKYPDFVGVDDEVAPVLLDFWSNYVNTISEESFQFLEEDTKPAWLEKAAGHVFQVVAEFLQKIIFPPAEVTKQWDSDSKKTFKVFRIDVRDIIQEAYEVLRETILEQFIDFTIRAFDATNWLELEAGLFCLISIGDAMTESNDSRLQRLFERPLYQVISGNGEIPAVTQRTAVEMIAAFDSFFLRHPEYLPQVLPFLLSALAQPSLAHGAAKSFASLCSECRKSLTGELGSFFQMYQQFLSYQTAEEFTKSRVLEGIAAIVQAQDSDEKRLAGVQQLFEYIAHDAMQAVNITKEGGDAEQGQVLALTTLKCLAAIGKALQASDEEVIDLVSDQSPSQFWTQGPGKPIQNQIINFVNYLTQVFPMSDEIIEAACNVLRAGFKETVPGPFVLPPSVTIDYILKTNVQTPRLPYVLDTACCWISCHKLDKSPDFQVQVQRLLHHVLSILQALQNPRNDPEISVGCIELIQKFVSTNARIFTTESPEVLKAMFDFSVECLQSPEVLPKRAAAQLWKDIFELAGNTKSQDQSTGQDIMNHFGAAVTFALMYNICGEVDYTSLEHVLIPLRKLITADRNAKANITNALTSQPLIIRVKDDPNTENIVRRFIESLMRNARSSSAFKETVKEFWQRCKHMQMQFAPQYMHPGHRFALGVN